MKSICRVIFFIFILYCSPSIGQNSGWQWNVVGKMPQGLYGSAIVAVDSAIYILGGYSDSLQSVTDWIYAYKPATNQWSFVGHMQKKRMDFLADKVGSKIYYLGGEVISQNKANGVVEVFNTKDFTTTIVDSNKCFNRSLATGSINNSLFYVVGGQLYNSGNQNYPYIFEYNVDTKNIFYCYKNNYSSMPQEEMSAILNNNIYVFGGIFNTVLNSISRYSITTRQYTPSLAGNMIKPRSNGQALKMNANNSIMILGGYDESEKALNTVELYTLTDSVTTVAQSLMPMNFKRKDCMAVNFNNSVYVMGGFDETGQFVPEIEKYNAAATDVKASNQPSGYSLSQNFPNPFNPSTVINYRLAEDGFVSLKVFNILGSQVAELENSEKKKGDYNVTFKSSALPSGVYFYQLKVSTSLNSGASARGFSETKKMTVLK